MELGLDLVIVSAEAKPPVAKLMDYKKFRFEQKKKAKEIKKNQKVTVVKEVQLSPVIDKHDLETKANIARKFILKDNKVKVTLRFKGRMIVHQDIGVKVMEEFQKLLMIYHPLEILRVLHTMFHDKLQIKAYASKYSADEIAKMINMHPYRVKLEIQRLKNVPLKNLVKLKENLTDVE